MELFVGTLDKISIVYNEPLTVRFILDLPNLKIPCIVKKRILANEIYLLPEKKYILKVVGRFNRKSQLIVKEITILNQENIK